MTRHKIIIIIFILIAEVLMKSVGIIAEYNPFHNGHLYHLNQSQALTDAECTIVVMSGNYVQRGEPSFMDKYTRTSSALLSGADLVVELPVRYATASAEQFAYGGISLLEKLGVDNVSFGSETDNLSALSSLSEILNNEPEAYKKILYNELQNGSSMPVARSRALAKYTSDEKLCDIISSPNNILAIEYLKSLQRLNSKIIPIAIKRLGNGYYEYDENAPLPSATMVRNMICTQGFDSVKSLLPDKVFNILSSGSIYGIDCDMFSSMLNYAIKTNSDLTVYADVSESIANKIQNVYTKKSFYTFNELADTIKSKELTRTRISRALLHIILNIKNSNSEINYVRILGMTKKGQEFLKERKKELSIPVIVNVADAKNNLSQNALSDFNQDILATDIYNLVIHEKFGISLPNEYRRKIIIV